jgi:hypothetical protein
LTGRRTSAPGWILGERTDRRPPSSVWNRGANRMYPNTMTRAMTTPRSASRTAALYTHPPSFSVGVADLGSMMT